MELIGLAIFMVAFSYFFPQIFRAFYWMLTLSIMTVGPACVAYLAFMAFGMDVSFTACAIGSFCLLAVPFLSATDPKPRAHRRGRA